MTTRKRFRSWAQRAQLLADGLAAATDLTAKPKCFTLDERVVDEPANCVVLQFESDRFNANSLADLLAAEDPQILTIAEGEILIVAVDEMTDDEARYVAERIRALTA